MAGRVEQDEGSVGTDGAASGKSRRGFASMDRSRQREIASKGGRAAHAKGTAHEWSSDEARFAGQKGGIAVSRDRVHMATIGREGGESRSRASRAARSDNGGAGVTDRELARPVSREGAPTPGSTPAHAGPRDGARAHVVAGARQADAKP